MQTEEDQALEEQNVNASEGVENEETFEEETEEQRTQQPQPLTDEQLARRRGWKPREEWVGNIPPNFQDDPAKFNEEHEAVNPRLRHEVKGLNDKLSQWENKFNERLKIIEGRYQSDLKRQRESLLQEMESATETADTERFKRARSDLDALDAASSAPVKEEEKPANNGYDPNTDPNYRDWHAENSWYHSDRDKTEWAERVAAPRVFQRGIDPQTHGRQFYDEISKEVDQFFGNKGGNRGGPTVNQNGAMSGASGGRKQKTQFDDLPSEAKAEFKWMTGKNIFKNSKEGREEYAKLYFQENPKGQ